MQKYNRLLDFRTKKDGIKKTVYSLIFTLHHLKMKLNNLSYNLSLTKDQTLMLKAIGILLIVFHNISRWIYPATGENEFYFDQSALITTIELASTSVWMFFKSTFNFFGHYGVQIFVYLSGYGLVQSYLDKKPTWLKFVYFRFHKLYPTLVVAILLYLIYNVFILYRFPSWDILPNILAHLTLTSTLLPGMGQALVGPWWFFSTIFQLYLIFPLLIKGYLRYGSRWLLLIGFFAWAIPNVYLFINSSDTFNLPETFIGQMPVFILGIWFGTDRNRSIKWYIPLILLLLFCLGCYFRLFWPFTSLSITILLILMGKSILTVAEKIKPLSSLLLFIGGISVYLFAFNGFIRWPFVYIINMNRNHFWIILFMLLLFLVLLFSTAWFFTKVEGFWRQRILTQKSTLLKITYTTSLLIVPIILIAFGYNRHFQLLLTKTPVIMLANLEETDTTRKDIKNYKTEMGEKVIWLCSEMEYSYFERFNISTDLQKGATRLVISSRVLCDSIPLECWVVAENYLGNIKVKRTSNELDVSSITTGQWQPLELVIDLYNPLIARSEQFQFFFSAKTKGNVYIDQVEVKLE